jgi:hypothetical protein
LERHGFERIETGQLVETYAGSKFEETRGKAQKFGARGTTLMAYRRPNGSYVLGQRIDGDDSYAGVTASVDRGDSRAAK